MCIRDSIYTVFQTPVWKSHAAKGNVNVLTMVFLFVFVTVQAVTIFSAHLRTFPFPLYTRRVKLCRLSSIHVTDDLTELSYVYTCEKWQNFSV